MGWYLFLTGRKKMKLKKIIQGYLNEQEHQISNSHKQSQLDIILKTNPMLDDYHTGIRNLDDIKTLEELVTGLEEDDWMTNPDWGVDDIKDAVESKKITIYSSYPIKNGTFVTPSRMEAKNYAGNGKIYSSDVSIYDIAWIDLIEGVYAKK